MLARKAGKARCTLKREQVSKQGTLPNKQEGKQKHVDTRAFIGTPKSLTTNTLRSKIQSLRSSEADLGFLKDSIFHIFNKHATVKKKYLCANEAPFMTKELNVANMQRSRLRNKFSSEIN